MFNIIDIDNWERKERFNHFMNCVPCDYNITSNIDITALLSKVKSQGIKLYPTLIYILMTTVNQIKEMRLGYNDNNQLGYYEICHPSYTICNSEEGSFSSIWTNANDSFANFYSDYLNDIDKYSNSNAYTPKNNQPKNVFYVSSLPKVAFTSFDLNLHNNSSQNLSPIFTWGKYFKQGKKILIPLACHLHHAACDGYHASLIYTYAQKMVDEIHKWLTI